MTPSCSPGRKRVLEACDWRSAGKVRGEFMARRGLGRRGGGSRLDSGLVGSRKGPVPVRSAAPLAPGSEEDNGSWALTSDRLPCAPSPLWDGRKS